MDFHWEGFEWIDFHDVENSIISFIRRAKDRERLSGVRLQLHAGSRTRATASDFPSLAVHREIFNSDAEMFGGSNMGNGGCVIAEGTSSHGRPASAEIVIPPLGVVVFKPARPLPAATTVQSA